MAHIPDLAGQLNLTVVSAQGLAGKENRANPYVVVTVVSPSNAHPLELNGKTKRVKNCSSPKWEEDFSISFGVPKGQDDVLRLEVWDFKKLRHDKFMGQADLKLSDLTEGQETQLELPLKEDESKDKKAKVSGTITITATLEHDYHRHRAELKAKLKQAAELHRQEEELAAKKKQEEDEMLISQVRLTHESAQDLVRAFHQAAQRNSVSRSSFKTVFAALDSPIQDAIKGQISELDVLFDFLDQDHTGELDLHELLFGISTLTLGSFDEKAELLFHAMDIDGSGTLNRAEVEGHFLKLNKAMRNYLMKGINEMYYRRTHNNLPEQDLNHMTNALMINVQEVLKADSVFPAGVEAITLDDWRKLIKAAPQQVEWLVSPEVCVRSLGPNIIAEVESALPAK